MNTEERREKIDRIERFPDELDVAVAGLTDAQLDHRPPGEWSVRQNVHHLADSHANAYIRMKMALTEDNPTIKFYSQDAFAELVDTRIAPLELSLPFIRALHGRWVYLMRSLSEGDWTRGYHHPEYGPTNLTRLLDNYSRHCDAHLDQMARALADYEGSQA